MKRHAAAALGACGLLLGSPLAVFAHAQLTTTVQFDREIVHILDDHCVMCHAAGGLAFPLVTYEQTYQARWQIRQDALSRRMAPWAAVAGYGEFANDNALTQREIDFLSSWAESYGPRNNGQVYTASAAAPQVVRAHFDFNRWALGAPDVRLPLAANTVPPGHTPAIQHATLDPKLTAVRWLKGLEYKPGDRSVVHSASFFLQETGQWLGSWTPWHPFMSLPQGSAWRLPAGSHIAAEILYYGTNAPVTDSGSLGLYFSSAQATVPRAVTSLTLATNGPGAVRKAAATLEEDTNVLALQPQLIPGVESIEVAARKPDGATQILLFARGIPLDWPTPYVLATPVPLSKGTRLSVIEHYATGTAASAATVAVTFVPGAALAAEAPHAVAVPQSTQRFKLTGTVKSVDIDSGRVLVQHGEIPGFMAAMTMSYSVGKSADLKQVAAGDQIQSDVVTGAAGTYLENIKVIKKAH